MLTESLLTKKEIGQTGGISKMKELMLRRPPEVAIDDDDLGIRLRHRHRQVCDSRRFPFVRPRAGQEQTPDGPVHGGKLNVRSQRAVCLSCRRPGICERDNVWLASDG